MTWYKNYIFSKPSFITGMGSAFNIWGNYFDFKISKTAEQADINAIQSDRKAIGEDVSKSISLYNKNLLNE